MNEATIKGALFSLLRAELPRFVIIRHEDKGTYGIPDASITGNGKTSWWEIKYANPDFQSHGMQELTMKRLANQGYARYVIYQDISKTVHSRSVYIVDPSAYATWEKSGTRRLGFDHMWIAEQVREVHRS